MYCQEKINLIQVKGSALFRLLLNNEFIDFKNEIFKISNLIKRFSNSISCIIKQRTNYISRAVFSQ